MSPNPQGQRPIAARDSLWIEAMTWMEVRDSIRAGRNTAIVPTGGVEQSGPYLVTGKHNVILRATSEAIARRLGNALVAPVVPFVPEGGIDPPSGHMRYPGTIGVEEDTFRALLRDIVRSLRAQGFRRIVLIGDSGGNQAGLQAVAGELDSASGTRVIHVAEYYDWPERQRWLAAQGFRESDEGLHDELSSTAIMMSIDPASVRLEERAAAGKASINGVSLRDTARIQAAGRGLLDHIAEVTAAAIRRRLGQGG